MGKQKSIASIGFQIPGNSDLLLEFTSRKSLMDYDVILFAPILPYYQMSSVGDGYYQGKVCYGESGSFKLKGDLEHWKNELTNALNAGKTVFFLLSDKEDFFIDSGQRSYSGTGRNRSTTINVGPGNNYQSLPTNIGTLHTGSGKQIVFSGLPAFKNLYEKFKEHLEYRVYLENVPNSDVIFTGKDKSKTLGMVMKVGGGRLITLPFIEYDEESFTETKKDKKGEDKEYWTKEAMGFGSSLTQSLLEIDAALQGYSDKTPLPPWVGDIKYLLEKEKVISKKITKNNKTLKQLTNENIQLQSEFEEVGFLKGLLYEQGKPLERVVSKALEILGFSAENYDDGELEMDQVIVGPEKLRCVGECEGKDSKDINIDKLRQLVETLNADSYRDEITERASGILFGNAQRLIEPEARTLDFTDKCIKSAEREKIALIRTVDLFPIAKYLSENVNEDYKKSCREAIYNGFGKIIEFPPIPNDDKSTS